MKIRTGYTRVTVYDSRIDAMFKPGGEVHGHYKRKAQKVQQRAVRTAPFDSQRHLRKNPSGTKHLKSTIRIYDRPLSGANVRFEVVAEAPHGLWVHEGNEVSGATRGWIYPRYGKALAFIGKGGNPVVVARVKSHKGNPWLRRALEKEME